MKIKTTTSIIHAVLCSVALVCFLPLSTHAVNPPPDGGYPGGNTAEGDNALLHVNTAIGINNTAVGANALRDNTTGQYNVAVGSSALASNTTGDFNMAIGTEALAHSNGTFNLAIGFRTLFLNSTGSRLTAIGAAAVRNNTIGSDNTGIGSTAMRENTTGEFNTAIGSAALRENTIGDNNTAIGADALSSNTNGTGNTATGALALFNNAAGNSNTANGLSALQGNITGGFNTATGSLALTSNTAGSDNTATGYEALNQNTTGTQNNAFGASALSQHMTGDSNNAVGSNALLVDHTGISNNAFGNDALAGNINGNFNTAIGDAALLACHGSSNTAIGVGAGANVNTAHNAICVGSPGADVSDSFYVANVFETSIAADNLPVRIDVTGRLGTQSSSRRFKKDIATMETASEAILSLRPVTFHYKTDTKGAPQFGLIAEEVAKVNPALVLPDKEGKPYTVRYDAVNAMLLNEFLKEHHQVQDLKAIVAVQQKQIEALTAGLQKVSAQQARVTIAFFIMNFINVFLFEVDCSKSARNQQSPPRDFFQEATSLRLTRGSSWIW